MTNNDVSQQQPSAAMHGLEFIPQGRASHVLSTFSWVKQAWQLFSSQWLYWLGAIIVIIAICALVFIIPLINLLAFFSLLGGVLYAAHCQLEAGKLTINHIFNGFNYLGHISIAILLFVLLGLIIATLIMVPASAMLYQGEGAPQLDIDNTSASIGLIVFAVVLALITTFLSTVVVFVLALIVINKQSPVSALLNALKGSVKNVFSVLVHHMVMLIITAIAVLPLGLGLFVAIPIGLISLYSCYRSVYYHAPTSQQSQQASSPHGIEVL